MEPTLTYKKQDDSAPLLVKLDLFEGPLDLLLFLVQREEVPITDIPIAKITQQYLDYLKAMETFNLEVAGEYIVMAATLIYIKTQLLLPRPQLEGEEGDPRAQLVQALVEYRRYKEAAVSLEKREETERQIFPHRDTSFLALKPEAPFELTATLFDLALAFKEACERLPESALGGLEITYRRVTIEERIAHVLSVLKAKKRVPFWELYADEPVRPILIVTFLALLELVRLQKLHLLQKDRTGEIWVMRFRAGERSDAVKEFPSEASESSAPVDRIKDKRLISPVRKEPKRPVRKLIIKRGSDGAEAHPDH